MDLHREPLIFVLSREGRPSLHWQESLSTPGEKTPKESGLEQAEKGNCLTKMSRAGRVEGLPELSEGDVVRHYTRLSSWNFHVDGHFYPLGSCTMKYNPRVNERISASSHWQRLHPYQPKGQLQGVLQMMWEAQEWLKEIAGMPFISLQPAAGAHGELTSLLMFRAFHKQKKGGEQRKIILVPESAHGTNPASATLAGFEVRTVTSSVDRLLHFDELERIIEEIGKERIAGAMITNPNTLGLFEPDIRRISDRLHEIGALLYIDGANLNAILGQTSYGLMGADAVHFNLHKTFAAPHGGGGPGAGPVAVSQRLVDFLPRPLVINDKWGHFDLMEPQYSIGRVKSFWGHVGVILKALAYMKNHGKDGLREISEGAVLNANYLKRCLSQSLAVAAEGDNLHEVIFSDKGLKKHYGITTQDLAKALLDKGYHAPTVYFPLVVSGAMMIEPTETENLTTLKGFCQAIKEILAQAKRDPESVRRAPYYQKVNRLDEAAAARKPVLKYVP